MSKKKITSHYVRAKFKPDSLNDTDRTVDVVFATEAPVKRSSWDGPFMEILSFEDGNVRMERINSGAPVLDNHTDDSVMNQLGTVVRAWIEDGVGMATLRFSKRQDVEPIWNDIKEKILTGISVGYDVHTYEITESDSALPVYRAIDWEPFEISMAPVPADYKSTVRSKRDKEYEVEVLNKNPKPKTMTPEKKKELREKRAAKLAKEKNVSKEEGMKLERTRINKITKAVRSAGIKNKKFLDELINNGSTIGKARKAILDEMAKGSKGPKQHVSVTGKDEGEKRREAMVVSLALRSGQVAQKDFKSEEIESAREFRGMSLLDLAKDSLSRAGVDIKGMDKLEVAKRALSNTTSDFPVLLEGTNRRILLNNYNAVSDTWRKFCLTGSVGDFRTYKRLRMGSFSRLDKLEENGEYKNKKITDADFETVSIDTFGNTINISRKMIVNDDLSAFSRLSAMLGRAAARSIEVDVYALLASNPALEDGIALFHASHNNLIATGSGGGPGVTQFDTMRQLMASQKDKDNNDFLDLRPSIWLGPIGLGGSARVVNGSLYDPDASNKLQRPNMVNGLFSEIVDTARLTGTAHYAFASPAEEPVIEVSFLDGQETPYMESETPFDMDGLRWKVRLDYGVSAIGYRGAVKNAGN